MTEFLGTWKFVSCSNFDGYLKELGINAVLRKLAALANPTIIVTAAEKDGKELWTIRWGLDRFNVRSLSLRNCFFLRTETVVKSTQCSFHLGQEFDETTIDDRKVKSTLRVIDEEGVRKLNHYSVDQQGRRSVVSRTIDGNLMNVWMEVNGVKSSAIFKKKAAHH